MPEYSSTTITPADGVKTPAMNGSTSGNYTLSALRDFILASKGQASGLASLDANGKLPTSQLPDLADDVLVYDSYALLPSPGTAGKLYITADENKMYRWDPDLATPDYVELSIDLSAYATIADLQDGTLEPLVSTKAKKDQNGNVIDTTYATKTSVDNIVDGTTAVGKATADAAGNTITTTYATKTEMQAADSELKGAIDANSKRISNLEQTTKQQALPVSYPDATYGADSVPASVADYVEVNEIRAKTREWNQIAYNGNFDGNTNGWSSQSASLSYQSSNVARISLTGSAWNNDIRQTRDFIANHYYIVFFRFRFSAGLSDQSLVFQLNDTTHASGFYFSTTWAVGCKVFKPTSNYISFRVSLTQNSTTQSGEYYEVSNIIIRDLSLILNDWADADITTENIPLMVKQIPDLLKYDDLFADGGDGYSLVTTTDSGVKSIGRNLASSLYVNAVSIGWATVLYAECELKPDTTYAISFVGASGNRIYPNETLFTDQSYFDATGTRQTKVYTTKSVLSAKTEHGYPIFKNWGTNTVVASFTEVQIEKGSSATAYSPYMEDTLTLPSPFTGKSAGDVAEVYNLESGKVSHPLRSISLGDNSMVWAWNASGESCWSTLSLASEIKMPANNNTVADIDCAKYLPVTNEETYGRTKVGISVASASGRIRIYDPSFDSSSNLNTLLADTVLNYALATPDADTDLGIVIDNFVKCQSGGTIRTIQTQETEIDSCLDVTYETIPV